MRRIPKIYLAIEKTRTYGRGLLRGISKYARIHGPWMFLTNHEFYHGGSPSPFLDKTRIDGAIIRESPTPDMKRVFALKIPIIVSCHMSIDPGYPHITTDCEAIGRMGAEHLLQCGFRNFAFCGTSDAFWSTDRHNGFAARISKAGFRVNAYKMPSEEKTRLWINEQYILSDWLKSLPKPIGIMACTDDRARDLIEACEMAGIRVPEEAAVLGVDDDSLVCDMAAIPISSVALNTEQAGYDAAELLDRTMKGRKLKIQKIIVHPTHVVARRSTDILAVDDPAVAKAVRFIRDNANQPIQVADVAKYVALSERNLFDRFKKTLGKTVYDEIQRVRIDRICWMLETTHLPIKEIAEIMGMPDDKHLARYFNCQKRMTPLAWRKQHSRKQ